jgi:hypothetical protein
MRERSARVRKLFVASGVFVLLAAACGGGDGETGPGGGGGALNGLFGITAGECSDAAVTAGSYFRMVQSGGNAQDGPFVPNGDSPCGDNTFTPLRPGTDGGLQTGDFQPAPDPAFDDNGNGTATLITEPTPWFAITFANATNQTDPQTGAEAQPPSITNDGGTLSGDLGAFAASWNGEHFNQGSPKPDGTMPGNTTAVSGTYDADTGAYTLEWTSQIVGGPFNNFTGVWHLEGSFEAA